MVENRIWGAGSCQKASLLNTSNHGRGEKMICTTPDGAINGFKQ